MVESRHSPVERPEPGHTWTYRPDSVEPVRSRGDRRTRRRRRGEDSAGPEAGITGSTPHRSGPHGTLVLYGSVTGMRTWEDSCRRSSDGTPWEHWWRRWRC